LTDILALDRSERFKDQDGHLHVRASNLSKACVNPYRGSEIPGHEALGLDPNKIYRLFRDPKELEKAAPTFNNLRLMSRHVAVSAADPKEHLVAGSTGSEARFEHPYIVNSLVIWRAEDIEDVESKEKCELSAGYYYQPEMIPGVYEGQPYDGRMTEIKANHIALVEAGRAGPDVLVADSGEIYMPALTSRKAITVKATLAALLRPNLLPGTTLALDQALGSVNRLNWQKQKPIVLATVEAMARPALKQGIAFDSLRAVFDEMDKEDEETEAEDDEVEAMDAEEEAAETEAREREERDGMKAEDRAKAAKDRRTARDKKRAADKKAMDARKAMDIRAKAMDAWRKAGKNRKALDKLLGHKASDKEFEEWAKEEEEEPEHAENARRAHDETEGEREAREAKDKKAMDEMTADIRKAVMAEMNAAIQARQDVRPHVGEVALAFDTAEKIYAFTLKAKGVSVDGVHPSAYRAMVGMIPRASRNERTVALALDNATPNLADMFPGIARIRQL
jgi:hypothetical protein